MLHPNSCRWFVCRSAGGFGKYPLIAPISNEIQSISVESISLKVLDSLATDISLSDHYKFLWWPHSDHVAVFNVDKTDKVNDV